MVSSYTTCLCTDPVLYYFLSPPWHFEVIYLCNYPTSSLFLSSNSPDNFTTWFTVSLNNSISVIYLNMLKKKSLHLIEFTAARNSSWVGQTSEPKEIQKAPFNNMERHLGIKNKSDIYGRKRDPHFIIKVLVSQSSKNKAILFHYLVKWGMSLGEQPCWLSTEHRFYNPNAGTFPFPYCLSTKESTNSHSIQSSPFSDTFLYLVFFFPTESMYNFCSMFCVVYFKAY